VVKAAKQQDANEMERRAKELGVGLKPRGIHVGADLALLAPNKFLHSRYKNEKSYLASPVTR
jgi:hypothetical protein